MNSQIKGQKALFFIKRKILEHQKAEQEKSTEDLENPFVSYRRRSKIFKSKSQRRHAPCKQRKQGPRRFNKKL